MRLFRCHLLLGLCLVVLRCRGRWAWFADRRWQRWSRVASWSVADGAVDTLFVCYQSCPSFGHGHEPIQESSAALVCVCVAFLGFAEHFVVSALGAILREPVFLEIRVSDPECCRHRPFPSGSVGFSPGRRFSCLQLWLGSFSQQPWRGLELQNPFRHASVLDRFTV